ncbi:hypothetical protein BED65_15280 [Listeria monocytogenes]|nr:hypothetical protein [Listeria monocytogenes]
MGQITTFIQELQHIGHQEAPYRSVHLIINDADFPKYTQKKKIAYIPDPILEQLFANKRYLHLEVAPII